MHLFKKCLSALISASLVLGGLSVCSGMLLHTEAASFEDVNQSSVFVKQQESDTCTLAANVMLLRRTAMMNGSSDWESITESAARSTLWYEGAGMRLDYTYKGITVTCVRTPSTASERRAKMIEVLKEHPEGVVIYDYAYPHAILLTDYTDGVFYCADPANNVSSGRIPISKALVQVEDAESYWYVVSPDVQFTDTLLNEKWEVTSTDGIRLRSGAGTSYTSYTVIPYKTQITVTKKKTADGYTWGYTTYNGYTGWCALDYAQCIDSSLTNSSAISATSIVKGQEITLTGKASGGTGSYQYQMLAKHSADSSWTILNGYNDTSTHKWTPAKTGTYYVAIKVKDTSGNIVSKEYTLTVNSMTALSNTSTISSTNIIKGQEITLTGKVSGGAGSYRYQMVAKHSTDSSWTILNGYNSTSTHKWTPSKTGTYYVAIKAKDALGNIVSKEYTLTVNAMTALINNSTMNATTITKGQEITFTGSASGGAGSYRYQMVAKHSTDSSWTILKDYSTVDTHKWTPAKKGTYYVAVKVKDAFGKVVSNEFVLTVE